MCISCFYFLPQFVQVQHYLSVICYYVPWSHYCSRRHLAFTVWDRLIVIVVVCSACTQGAESASISSAGAFRGQPSYSGERAGDPLGSLPPYLPHSPGGRAAPSKLYGHSTAGFFLTIYAHFADFWGDSVLL